MDDLPSDASLIRELLLRGYTFSELGFVACYKSSATNLINRVHHGYIVAYHDDSCVCMNPDGLNNEKSFVTPGEAADFYVAKRKELIG